MTRWISPPPDEAQCAAMSFLTTLPSFNHESNSLQLGDVCDRVARDGDEVGELPGLHRAH